jgi:hypothetical protein
VLPIGAPVGPTPGCPVPLLRVFDCPVVWFFGMGVTTLPLYCATATVLARTSPERAAVNLSIISLVSALLPTRGQPREPKYRSINRGMFLRVCSSLTKHRRVAAPPP